MPSKVTCKACGMEWASREDYLKKPGCSHSGCAIKAMAKRNNPPAILVPSDKKTNIVELRPQQHAESCVCNRCMEKRSEEYDAELRAEQDHIRNRGIRSMLLDENDNDDWDNWRGWGQNPQSKYYEREPRINRNNDKEFAGTEFPIPKQIKMRVNKKDCVVPSTYDPEQPALFVEVPIAVGASIFPKGAGK